MHVAFMLSLRHPLNRLYPLVSVVTGRNFGSGTGAGTVVVQEQSEPGPDFK